MATLSPFSFRVFDLNGKTYTSLISAIVSQSLGEKVEEATPIASFQRALSYPERKPIQLEPIVRAWIESSNLIKRKLTETLDFPIVCPFPQLTVVIEKLRIEYRGKVFDVIIKDEEIKLSDDEILEILDALDKIRKLDGQTKFYYLMILDLVFSATNGNEDEVEKFKQILKQWENKTSLERYPKFKKIVIQVSNLINPDKVDSISKVSIGISEFIRNYVMGHKINFKNLKIRFAPQHREYRREYISHYMGSEEEDEPTEEVEKETTTETVKEEDSSAEKKDTPSEGTGAGEEKVVEIEKTEAAPVEVVRDDEEKEEEVKSEEQVMKEETNSEDKPSEKTEGPDEIEIEFGS